MRAPQAAALLLLAAALPLQAHDWYPPSCCSGGDCAPIEDRRVQDVPVGLIVDGRHFIPHAKVQRSQDGRYHGCWPDPAAAPVCVFAPSKDM